MQNGIEHALDFFAIYKKAAWEKDVDSMISLYHDEVVVFDMWGGKGFSPGIKEWSETITDWLTSLKDERVRVSFDMIDIQESHEVAFASALIRYQALAPDNTVLRGMRNRITLGFIRSNGSWKVKHQHTSAPVGADLKATLTI